MLVVAPVTSKMLEPELILTASRSGGAGGQHVNKVSTKITLRWDVANSTIISPEQKELLLKKLTNRLTDAGVLLLNAQGSRSQLQNKEDVLAKLDHILALAFRVVKIRKASKPNKLAKKKRLDRKSKHAEKKQWRRKL